jgi:predicted nucleic acid-binding protein
VPTPRYYLDTSVLNYAFVEDAPEHRDASLVLLDMIRGEMAEGYVSDLVLREVSRAPDRRRTELQRLIFETQLEVLEVTEEALRLAGRYIAEAIIPRRYRDDAIHIAVAVVNNLDCVVSWNFRHIVRPATRRLVNAINRLLGYPEIEIASPEEVV